MPRPDPLIVIYAGSDVGPRLRRLIEAKRGPRRASAVARDAGVNLPFLFAVLAGHRNVSAEWLGNVLASIPATEDELWAD